VRVSGKGDAAGKGREKSTSERAAKKPSPRELRRQQRIELSREQILDTAEELFAERGYHETNLRDVAERCEFSVGSIYSFFDSKDALYLAVLMRHGLGQREEMARLVAEGIPADERLVAMVRAQIEHGRKYPAWAQLHAQMSKIGARSVPDVPKVYKEFHGEIVGLVAKTIEDGQREGTLRPGDPPSLARLCCALMDTFTLMDPLISDEPQALDTDEFVKFIRQTFTTTGPPRA
jgi:TetR/AcrR family transcriptional regulator